MEAKLCIVEAEGRGVVLRQSRVAGCPGYGADWLVWVKGSHVQAMWSAAVWRLGGVEYGGAEYRRGAGG